MRPASRQFDMLIKGPHSLKIKKYKIYQNKFNAYFSGIRKKNKQLIDE